ncbi:MAG: M15 family metallopeptidase [Fibrobacteres bacterium]|nr:M15 family metallopeptidase [Fibrobacterota bacterium]
MTMDLPRPRVLKTNPEVAAYYGSGLPNFLRAEAKKIRAFGDPTKSDWKDKNIIPVKLEGFGPDLSQTRSIDFHKFLAKRLQKVFQEILAENRASSKPYILKGNFSGGYLFRYKTEMIDDKWRNDPFYAEPLRNLKQGEDIRIAFAEWDRKQGTFHLPAPRTKDRAIRSTLLSDHAYGSAIDLNYTDNNMVKGNTSTADMPRRIVEIFEANGFRWGGFYQQTNHDYMHFEWGLLRPPIGGGAARNFFFPLELGKDRIPAPTTPTTKPAPCPERREAPRRPRVDFSRCPCRTNKNCTCMEESISLLKERRLPSTIWPLATSWPREWPPKSTTVVRKQAQRRSATGQILFLSGTTWKNQRAPCFRSTCT